MVRMELCYVHTFKNDTIMYEYIRAESNSGGKELQRAKC